MLRNRVHAFTLSELLIALAILGMISTFTIPKVLQVQQNNKYKAAAKEVASMISGAYEAYKLKNNNPYMKASLLAPYMNYVKLDTISVVDEIQNVAGTYTCGSGGTYCYQMHAGGVLFFWDDSFCQTPNDTGVHFRYDPDGIGDAKYKSVAFWLYKNGALRTSDGTTGLVEWGFNGSTSCSLSASLDPGAVPPWFSWN